VPWFDKGRRTECQTNDAPWGGTAARVALRRPYQMRSDFVRPGTIDSVAPIVRAARVARRASRSLPRTAEGRALVSVRLSG
jgi:hypothetical protein